MSFLHAGSNPYHTVVTFCNSDPSYEWGGDHKKTGEGAPRRLGADSSLVQAGVQHWTG